MSRNWEKTLISKVGYSMFVTLGVLMLLISGSKQAAGQACAAQNWAASTPNIWAATVSDLVMLNNSPTTNQPTIPIMLYDGTYSPWGYSQHPQPVTQLNTNWSCPSGTPVISIAGAGRETVSFQLFITAPAATPLSSVSVAINPLTGPGTTLTSDNTGTSAVTRYLEGYVPYSCTGATAIGCVQASGSIPDPLIPFYDPYDSGNPAVATPFNVQQGTTQGVWVNISIPANQTAGAYSGTLTVSGTGISATTIPVNLTVWNGNLPGFDAGSINPSYADMLKVWLPLYGVAGGEGVSGSDIPLFQKYQVMAHNYDIDAQYDPFTTTINGAYPSTNPTSLTTDGTTSSIDWTVYDSYFGPSLTPGGLFSDGTAMRVLDGPMANGGAGAWVYGYPNWNMYNDVNQGALMPAGLVSLTQNFATQISRHFSSNHTTKGWVIPDLMTYTFDEEYNDPYGHTYQLPYQPHVYQIMSQVMQAINASNSSLSPTWDASTAPIRQLTTDEPACMEDGDSPEYLPSVCADHINLSYPGGALATPGYTNSWVTTWSPGPSIFMTGQPGPGLSYGVDPAIIDGTGYQYTLDLTQGVPALSTAPAPIERWTYNNGGGGSGGMYRRMTYWAAYKYGQDITVPSLGDPHPAAPAPGGLWSWIGDWWGGGNGNPSPSSCNSASPFVQNGGDQGDTYIFPGNELGCYYTANPVGQAVLTTSPAVNTNCTANNYSTCNGISGPIATRELEQWRRGYEDYEYLYLYGKQAGRAAANAVVASVAAEGLADWEGYDWENIDGAWYEYGVTPVGTAYSGNCTWPSPINSPIFGNLPAGLPNGPTGQGSSGPSLGYVGCEGLWSPDPYAYEFARLQLAEALGFAPASIPSVTGLSPSNGSPAGGTPVQISGTNFTGATAVEFGGVEAASFTVNSATSITAVTPPGTGVVDVQVFTPAGGSPPHSGDQYDYSLVTVTGVSPTVGSDEGGNPVSITGTNFSPGATVMFGSIPATNVVVNSDTNITATAPAGSGSVNVIVSSLDGTSVANNSDIYTYEPPPTLASLSLSSGPVAGGTSVTITGTGFASGGTVSVSFGANLATNVVVASDTSLTATSPAGTSIYGGMVNVQVINANGTSAIGSADQFTYISPVAVTSLSVQTGPTGGGTQVVITGTDFTGATAVMFGANPAASFAVNSATQITATSPAGGGTVDVTVFTPPYGSAPVFADEFSYAAAVASGGFTTLPTTVVGSTSSSQNVQLTLASTTPISSITVPPAQNGVQEFTVGTVTGCTLGGGSNPSGTVCTVPITFSPQYPGIRTGALTFTNNGEVIGTAGLAGIGQGPEVAVSPGSLVMAVGGGVNAVTASPQSATTVNIGATSNFAALAMDGAGNLYISDNAHCLAYKVTAATNQIAVVAGNYIGGLNPVTPSTTPEPAIGSNTCPSAIAVDGAGNIYLVDSNITVNVPGNGLFPGVVEEVSAATGEIAVIAGNVNSSLTATTTPQPALSVAIWAANSLATDTAGNLYISDYFNNVVDKVTPDGNIVVVAGSGGNGGAPFTTPVPATSVSLNGPTGMVVDQFGNLYITDQNINLIEMVNPAGQIVTVAGGGGNPPSSTPQSAFGVGLNAPGGLAVDGAGNLYIGDIFNEVIEQVNLAGQLVVVAGGGGIIPSATPESALSAQLGTIQGVEVDGAGNIYIADGQTIGNGGNMIEKVGTLSAPLNFPFTNAGTSSPPQSVNLTNIGNQSLTLNSLASPADYPLQTTGTCTVTGQSSQTLLSGSNCSVAFDFDPTTGGVLNEAATLYDNNLNKSNAQQLISFIGTAFAPTAATPTFSPAGGTFVAAQTVTISDSTSGAAIYYTTDGVTTPTTNSTRYSGPISVGSTETIQAIAAAADYTSSALASATYTIIVPAATPTFSPGAGSYGSAQTVTISDGTSGATIYYTTDGTPPTTSSATYSSAITVSLSKTLKALAVKTGYSNSAVGSAAYTISIGGGIYPVTDSFSGGSASSPVALSSDWTSNQNDPTDFNATIVQAGGTATLSLPGAGIGMATYTGQTFTTDQYADLVVYGGTSGNNDPYGPCVRTDPNGNGYCYFPNGQNGQIYPLKFGLPVLNGIPGNGGAVIHYQNCPHIGANGVNSGDTFEISIVGLTLTCKDLTTGASNSAIDSTTTPLTGGSPGMFLDQSFGGLGAAYQLGSFAADCIPSCNAAPEPAELRTPTGTTLTGTTVPFTWSPGGATLFQLFVGTTGVGSHDVYNSGPVKVTTESVIGLPSNGEKVYVRLYWYINGTWRNANYTYKAYGAPTPAALTTPAPGTTLSGTSVTFTWNPGNTATLFQLFVGTTGVGSHDVYNSGPVKVDSEGVTGLPSNGEKVYVRLYWLIGSTWSTADYTYKASGSPAPAALTTPTPGTTLSGTSVPFTWSAGSATYYQLFVGTTGVGSHDVYNSGPVKVTTESVIGLPSNGEKVYVRLYWLIGSTWSTADYTYNATGSPTPAALTTPTPGTTLSGTSVNFTWSAGNATYYQLFVGTTGVGSHNLYNSGPVKVTTESVTGLPSNGSKVYVRLYWLINGAWSTADYTYKAQ